MYVNHIKNVKFCLNINPKQINLIYKKIKHGLDRNKISQISTCSVWRLLAS